MKICLVALVVAVAVVYVSSTPLPDNFEDVVEEARGERHRRVTCDLLSFGGKVGDSACAANCLSMGKAGGRCNGGVCQCRKTTFAELWNRRFG
ncbi:defensin [Cephus cinctus]|uniref:Defensin n=1 Tax=Cephus cinctus TaxID=211228 RepID=A0AAJ7FRJ0_CEPCN|nr:defensin [Cephus cinctus]